MELQEKQTSESTTTLHQNESVENLAEPRKQTAGEKTKSIINLITIEPVLFAYLFATSLALGAIVNMPFEMGCRTNLKLNDTLCSDISVGIIHVAVLYGNTLAWAHPVSTTITAFLVLCFGSFSDRYKIRKPFFILPILGEVFSCIGLMLCAVFISQWPIGMFFVLATILPSLFGGGQTAIMAIYSYITDISTKEERTTRIGFVELTSLMLTPVGVALSGIIFEHIGYYGVYTICLCSYLFAVIYGLIFIKEKQKAAKREKNICIDVFNVKSVIVDMLKIVIRKRFAYRRMLLILTYISYILIKGPTSAEAAHIRTYAIQEFKWKTDYYGYYQAFDVCVHVLGMLLAVTIFTKKFQLNDLIIAAIACIFKIIVGIWYAFGHNVVMFCIGPFISVFSGLFVIALRSLATKLVDISEIAKAQALFAICEALCPIIYNTMYANFYRITHGVFHGAFFLLTTALVVPPLLIVLVMYAVYKKDIDNPEPEPQNEKQENSNGNDIEIARF